MKNFGDRLKASLQHAQMTQQQLADKVGISQQLINYATTDRAKGSKHSFQMAKALRVSPEWLSTGEGEMLNADKPAQGQQDFIDGSSRNSAVIFVEMDEVINIQNSRSSVLIPCPTEHSASSYATRVKDNTMTAQYGRSYPEGSIIFVDPERASEAQNGDRVVAIIEGEIVSFKQYGEADGQRYLQPINIQYPSITKPFEIIGLVIGLWIPEN
jgi:SOS-response transcriptional repressor LexA